LGSQSIRRSASPALPHVSTVDSRLQLPRAAPPSVAASDLRRLPLPPALSFDRTFDLRLRRVRPTILRANLRPSVARLCRPSHRALALRLRFEPAFVTILRIPAADSSTVPSSGAASRLVLAAQPFRLAFSPVVSLHRRPGLSLCCPARPIGLRRSTRAFRPHPRSAVSLHRRPSFRICCPARRLTCVSRRAFRPHLQQSRQLAPPSQSLVPLPGCSFQFNRSASPSTPPVSLRRQLHLQICRPAFRWLAPPVGLSASPSVPPSACAVDGSSGFAFLPGRSTCIARPAFQPYLST